MRIICWQTILMKYHTLFFFWKLWKISENLSSAAVVIGSLRVKIWPHFAAMGIKRTPRSELVEKGVLRPVSIWLTFKNVADMP